MEIKICGMSDCDNIQHISKMHPDYMGFIFYKSSPRFVGNILNSETVKPLTGKVKRVGVFVNEGSPKINSCIDKYLLDCIQLHGDETSEQCLELRAKATIIKAFQMDDGFNFEQLAPYLNACDYFLFDTKSSGYGGSGNSFDLQLLNDYPYDIPFFISGGLGPDNIEQLLKFTHPLLQGFDFNSKLEAATGLKDLEKTRFIIDKIRNYEQI